MSRSRVLCCCLSTLFFLCVAMAGAAPALGGGGTSPSLKIPKRIPGVVGVPLWVPVGFKSGDADIAALAFSLDIDECLEFDPSDDDGNGIPDDVLFDLSDASGSPRAFVFWDDGDTDGELDIAILDLLPPLEALPDGELVQVLLTPTCEPDLGNQIEAPVRFSEDPEPSFGGTDGQSLPGQALDGSVLILSGEPGDCNSDGRVDAGDLIACVLESFDGDGQYWLDAPGGGFSGNPIGCDANGDQWIDAGDLSCKLRLIFLGPGSCGDARLPARGGADDLRLAVAEEMRPHSRHFVDVPIYLDNRGEVNSLIFSLDFDQEVFALSPRDRDGDGVPDAVRFNLDADTVASVTFDRRDLDGELDFFVLHFTEALRNLDGEPIAVVRLRLRNPNASGISVMRFSEDPPVSFGDLEGRSVPGTVAHGTVVIERR